MSWFPASWFRASWFRALYAAAIFAAGLLLFLIEPIAARRILPLLGGSAAVWITCLVFFQTGLLGGYLYAHGLIMGLTRGAQLRVHAALLLIAGLQSLAVLRWQIHAITFRPIFSIFLVLGATIGLPFFALSASGPLLQAWFSKTAFPAELMPRLGRWRGFSVYQLYAVSNAGCLVALLLYPVVIEPQFSLGTQTELWTGAFLVFILLTWLLMARFAVASPAAHDTRSQDSVVAAELATRPRRSEQYLWFLLAACGSLMLSATTSHLSQNVAAIPLLWVLPLSAYLASMTLAFAGEQVYPRDLTLRLLAVLLGAAGYILYDIHISLALVAAVPLFCTVLFIASFFCHAELYRLKPANQFLTSFYLAMAAGGAFGALLVGVVAPAIFSANYELVIALAATAGLAAVVTTRTSRIFWIAAVFGFACVLIMQIRGYARDALAQARSFYGTVRVTETHLPATAGTARTLYHGIIEHGTQLYGSDLRTIPTTYYAYDSGVGMALRLCCNGHPKRVGVIGLGAGTLAAYGKPGDVFRFYEIDPLVERIARHFFTYLRESPAEIQIALGDARLSLAQEQPERFDVLAVDAFSGDAVPVHLLTAEAFDLYRHHLRSGGIVAVHISSQYLDLAPLVLQQAQHAGLSTVYIHSVPDDSRGEFRADWVLVTSDREFLAQPEVAHGASPIEPRPKLRLWTDDYNSLLPLLK